ncbi:hypothetical protein [Paenilisteria rocourtiae]|uniref:Uncharacterized protein n=1 Tax=Listeria rocourtiae TaxID=647910 RepID=A0A4V3DPK6_9LIST|nr:hypothetical protein [Listeria rocourtiae]TDR52576.1 hypothetical protein DFP96_10713 [Listeria rocourtiae]
MKELWLPLTDTIEFQQHAELITVKKDETFYYESGIILVDDGLVSCTGANNLHLIGTDGMLFNVKSLTFRAWKNTCIWYLPMPLLRRMGDRKEVCNLILWSKQQQSIWRECILSKENVKSAILNTLIELFIKRGRERFYLVLDELCNEMAYYSKEMIHTACLNLSEENAIYFSRRNNKITFSATAFAQYIDRQVCATYTTSIKKYQIYVD